MELNPEHLEISVVADLPKGGQHVGVIPRAVCVKHIPSGIKAECNTERSQSKNLQVAKSMIAHALLEVGWKE